MKRIINYLRSLLRVPVQVPEFEHGAPFFVCFVDRDYEVHPFAFFARLEDADFFCCNFSDKSLSTLYLYAASGCLKKVYML